MKQLRYTTLVLVLIASVLMMSQPAVADTAPNVPLPAGTTYYAVAQGTSTISTTSTTPVDVANLSSNITIPSGTQGDVMVFFCGATRSQSITVVRAILAGAVMQPGALALAQKSTVNLFEDQCANFYLRNVAEGTKGLKVQWYATPLFGPATQEMGARSMIVIINAH